MELKFSRIQFTPDLMPADITGTAILQVGPETLQRKITFSPGPVFTQMLLADEINRTPPKTRAALLEAMQEQTVTGAEGTHQLDEPFVVLATQNLIEQEGTYPLPEAQLDRFLFPLAIEYPSRDDECRIVAEHSFTPLDKLETVLSREEILRFREAWPTFPPHRTSLTMPCDWPAPRARLTRARRRTSRNGSGGAPARAPLSSSYSRAGRGPPCEGRFNAACEDVATVASPVLRHRLVRTFRVEADGKTTDDIISQLLKDVPRDGE